MKISILFVFLLVFSTVTGYAQPEAIASQTDGAAKQSPAESSEDWRLEEEKLLNQYQQQMSAEEYLQALAATGMDSIFRPPGEKSSVSAEDVTSDTWTALGPFGDFSNRNGRVRSIHILPSDSSGFRMYVGASSGGLWYNDASISASGLVQLSNWVSLGEHLPNPSIGDFAVNPDNHRQIFIGTGDKQRYSGSGMYATDNEGDYWYSVNLPVTPDAFYRLFFIPGSNGRLIAATDQGILRSTDGGSSWTQVETGDITDLAINPDNPSLMFAVRRGVGILRSVNQGENWVLLTDTDLPPGSEWGRASIAISQSASAHVAVLVTYMDPTLNRYVAKVFSTANGNDTTIDWQEISNGLTGFKSGMCFHAHAISFHPDNPQKIYIGSTNLTSTGDGGSSWSTNINDGHDDITRLYFNTLTGSNILFICNDGGVYAHYFNTDQTVSLNGGSSGLNISQIDHIDGAWSMRVAGLQDNGVIRSLNSGQTWSYVRGGDGYNVQITDPAAQNFWMVDGYYPGLGSKIWRVRSGSSPEEIRHPGENNCSLYYDRYDSRMFSITNLGILSRDKNENAGNAWTVEIANNLQPDPYGLYFIRGNPVHGETVFCIYRKGTPPNDPNANDLTIIRKTNGAWSIIHRENVVPDSSSIHDVYPSDQWKNEFWITVEGPVNSAKILHTVNDGATWQDITGNLASLNVVESLAVTPFNPLIMYAGTDIGVYRTTDGGQHWDPFMAGLPAVMCKRLKFIVDSAHNGTGNHKLMVGTHGRGIYERLVPSSTIIYVDKNFSGSGSNGTVEFPYLTVNDALAAAPPEGAIIALRGDVYAAPITINRNVTLVTYMSSTRFQ